jgi:bifunctional DNA-binding transcriptional regulator/antitoxin component of YhaV-PrlF toxin-antitoxin module
VREVTVPLLEKRKIHAAGGSLAVTLPRGWLNYFGIKAGDVVEVVANGTLVIRPIPSSEVEEPGEVRDVREA